MPLETECGVTEISLNNAKKLIEAHGVPSSLDFYADKRNVVYHVHAQWPDGTKWLFIGFAWGYGGTGPAGLLQFFDLAKVSSLIPDDIPLDKYGKTDMTWFREVVK